MLRPHMKKTICRASLVLAVLAAPAIGQAQSASASIDLRLNLPVVLPQLVVVTPGVQVVPEVEEEVFFVDGFYWVRRDAGWYRSRSHRNGWVMVPVRAVPVRIVEIPRGKYKRYKPAKAERRRDDDRYEREHHRHEHHDREHGDRGHGKHGKKHKD